MTNHYMVLIKTDSQEYRHLWKIENGLSCKSQDLDHLGHSIFGILTVFMVELLSDLTVKYILSI